MTKAYLLDPTDDQLNDAFAEHVAHWKPTESDISCAKAWNEMCGDGYSSPEDYRPHWTRSTDLVLPWLEKMVWFHVETQNSNCWIVNVATGDLSEAHHKAKADDLVHAIVVALLRAHGVEIEFTKEATHVR